ncbi:MAG: hypothetical protein WA715_01120 [Candidatus Acidiferrum sp.]
MTNRNTATDRFEVDGANAARTLLKDRGISTQQTQVVWDAIALHTTPTIAFHKEPEGVMTIQESRWTSSVRVLIESRRTDNAALAEFPRLALKNQFRACHAMFNRAWKSDYPKARTGRVSAV